MIKLLLWIWQLPQNLVGWILTFTAKKENVYYCSWMPKKTAVSLGNYIFFAKDFFSWRVYLHELGHQKQSMYLGPLYLIVIGIPSVIRIAYAKVFKKSIKWYYGGFPEDWADRLGGIND